MAVEIGLLIEKIDAGHGDCQNSGFCYRLARVAKWGIEPREVEPRQFKCAFGNEVRCSEVKNV
ncbi:hypothetical protein B5K08_24220 [Rhizobium leguminosarum bv. trifolii]|uniref:Uncharacterized protein n=1 Tax=Rhizobium leguminosarum bv. trifolii TaxID=386 RepID=A0A3E1B6Q3_RHILT|nr:hypothetical protein B5K08_24220 [Rhizobium leguminosarum bv. trifolii]RFB86666.1 hypothetical protein B5K10_24210 [Rhizobium leguminosarum bv. trifolii]